MAVQLIESPEGPRVHIPLNLKRRSGRKQIIIVNTPETQVPEVNLESGATYRDAMVIAIARGFRWKKLLDDGKYESIKQMAAELGVAAPYMAMIMRLTLLAPDIIEAIIDGRESDGMSIELLRKPMSLLWTEQRQLLLEQASWRERAVKRYE